MFPVSHVKRLLSLCQVPNDSWGAEDHLFIKEVRQYIQTHQNQETEGEGKREGGSPGNASSGREGQGGEETGGEVLQDWDTLPEGPEGSYEAG